MKQIQNDHDRTIEPNTSLIALGLAVGLGVVFQWFFYASAPGIAFPIFAVIFTLCSLGLARKADIAIPRNAWLAAGACLLFAGLVAVRGGAFITLLNLAASFYLYSLMLYLMFWRGPNRTLSDFVLLMIRVPLAVLRSIRDFLYQLKPLRAIIAKHPTASRVLRGVIIAIPLLLVFVLLFSSADLVFRKYMTTLFSFNINADILARLIWAGIMSIVFCGAFGMILLARPKESVAASLAARPERDIETKVVLGLLNILFLMFIVIQLAYLFGGAHNVTGEGFTYAQYARKGFFELIAAAVLTLAVIAGAIGYTRHGLAASVRWLQLLAGGLILQVLVIMVSAFKRLSLYESAYGFTSLRVYSHLFIVWLAVVFGLLLLQLYDTRRRQWFAQVVVASVFVFLLTLNVINVDGFVARKNLGRYHDTGKIDVGYLLQLSDDATPEVTKALHALPLTLQEQLARGLHQKRENIQRAEQHWQAWNVARESSLSALNDNDKLPEEDLRLNDTERRP